MDIIDLDNLIGLIEKSPIFGHARGFHMQKWNTGIGNIITTALHALRDNISYASPTVPCEKEVKKISDCMRELGKLDGTEHVSGYRGIALMINVSNALHNIHDWSEARKAKAIRTPMNQSNAGLTKAHLDLIVNRIEGNINRLTEEGFIRQFPKLSKYDKDIRTAAFETLNEGLKAMASGGRIGEKISQLYMTLENMDKKPTTEARSQLYAELVTLAAALPFDENMRMPLTYTLKNAETHHNKPSFGQKVKKAFVCGYGRL